MKTERGREKKRKIERTIEEKAKTETKTRGMVIHGALHFNVFVIFIYDDSNYSKEVLPLNVHGYVMVLTKIHANPFTVAIASATAVAVAVALFRPD